MGPGVEYLASGEGGDAGFASNARWLVILMTLLLGIGWYYRWPRWALAVLVVIPAGLAIHGLPGHRVVGPHVILVACALLLVTIALNTGSPTASLPATGRNVEPLVSSRQQ
jgi:hypothetical protein